MKKTLLISLVILFPIGLFVLKTVWQSGSFKTIDNTFSGTIQVMEGLPGVEDITIDPISGMAFLSSDDRWAAMLHNQPVKGAIYTMDLNDPLPQPVNVTSRFQQEDFHPHVISLYQTREGKKILFVVNHRKSGSCVEVFEYKNDSLQHLESISDELIISPNDVVGVGERSFYVTNDHNEKVSAWRGIKDLLTIGTGNVCFYDGRTVQSTSIEGLKYANGINISGDGKKIYVAASTDRKILVYDRDIASGILTKSDEISTGTGVDNIELDTEGNLWVGCHPQLLKFLSHAKDEKAKSPSEIIRLRNKGNGEWEQVTVYLNDGSQISASSVGAVYKNILLIGPVFQSHFLFAKME